MSDTIWNDIYNIGYDYYTGWESLDILNIDCDRDFFIDVAWNKLADSINEADAHKYRCWSRINDLADKLVCDNFDETEDIIELKNGSYLACYKNGTMGVSPTFADIKNPFSRPVFPEQTVRKFLDIFDDSLPKIYEIADAVAKDFANDMKRHEMRVVVLQSVLSDITAYYCDYDWVDFDYSFGGHDKTILTVCFGREKKYFEITDNTIADAVKTLPDKVRKVIR